MSKYIRITPGQKCERCGGDNSYRSRGTKYCHKCAKEVAREKGIKDREYIKLLKARDTIRPNGPGTCNDCVVCYINNFVFCGMCGQRLRTERGKP